MSTHAEITRKVRRAERKHACRIAQIARETATVKSFRLSLPDASFDPAQEVFSFQPGQWVDFYAPGIEQVGGFSITSTPLELAKRKTFELAVKHSPRNPVAVWLHEEAKAGDEVEVRIGGEFIWEDGLWEKLAAEKRTSGRDYRQSGLADVIFIAGGVGLTPIYGMAAHLADLNRGQTTKVVGHIIHASKSDELLFRNRLESLAADPENKIRSSFFITRGSATDSALSSSANVMNRRITEEDLRNIIAPDGMYRNQLVFLCGPNRFEADMLTSLKAIGVPEDRVRFEKWW